MFGYSSNIDWDAFSEKEKIVILALPHGSGIDYDWYCEKQKNGKLACSNAYHVMNENGFYIGSADFSIRFHVDNRKEFRLMFHGSSAQYLNRQYGLREYLDDTIYYAILDV